MRSRSYSSIFAFSVGVLSFTLVASPLAFGFGASPDPKKVAPLMEAFKNGCDLLENDGLKKSLDNLKSIQAVVTDLMNHPKKNACDESIVQIQNSFGVGIQDDLGNPTYLEPSNLERDNEALDWDFKRAKIKEYEDEIARMDLRLTQIKAQGARSGGTLSAARELLLSLKYERETLVSERAVLQASLLPKVGAAPLTPADRTRISEEIALVELRIRENDRKQNAILAADRASLDEWSEMETLREDYVRAKGDLKKELVSEDPSRAKSSRLRLLRTLRSAQAVGPAFLRALKNCEDERRKTLLGVLPGALNLAFQAPELQGSLGMEGMVMPSAAVAVSSLAVQFLSYLSRETKDLEELERASSLAELPLALRCSLGRLIGTYCDQRASREKMESPQVKSGVTSVEGCVVPASEPLASASVNDFETFMRSLQPDEGRSPAQRGRRSSPADPVQRKQFGRASQYVADVRLQLEEFKKKSNWMGALAPEEKVSFQSDQLRLQAIEKRLAEIQNLYRDFESDLAGDSGGSVSLEETEKKFGCGLARSHYFRLSPVPAHCESGAEGNGNGVGGAGSLTADLQEVQSLSWKWSQRQLGLPPAGDDSKLRESMVNYLTQQMERQVSLETLSAAEALMGGQGASSRDRDATAVAYALDEQNLLIMGDFLKDELEHVIVSTSESYQKSKEGRDEVGEKAHFDNLQGICAIALAMDGDFLKDGDVSEGCEKTRYESQKFAQLAKRPWHERACTASRTQKSRYLKDRVVRVP